MQFCDECGSMMHADGEEMVCSSCGARGPKDEETAARLLSTEEQTDDVVENVDEAAFEGKPTAEQRCEACGNEEAWYEIRQTASADEPPTRFFKCEDGKSVIKSYPKTSPLASV